MKMDALLEYTTDEIPNKKECKDCNKAFTGKNMMRKWLTHCIASGHKV